MTNMGPRRARVQEMAGCPRAGRAGSDIRYMYHDQVFSKSGEYFSKKFEKVLAKVPYQA
ncbi:MAG: hypothetical protein Q4E80_00415 [Slackia faecicanis]|nr:hypothetical protein [Slackia faecicanis]